MCYLHFVERLNTEPYIIAYLTCSFLYPKIPVIYIKCISFPATTPDNNSGFLR